MGPDLSDDHLRYDALVPGGYEGSSLCDGGIGRGVPFGIGMPQDTRRMGMVLAEKRVSFLEMLAEKYQTTTDKRFLPNHAKPSLYEQGIRPYILPILLIGAILSEINVTLLEGKISVKLSVGDILIFITIIFYLLYSWKDLIKLAGNHITITVIGLGFILVSLSTSCIQNDYWLISLKFCIKICILFFLLVFIYQDSHVSSGTLSVLFLIMVFINAVGILEYFYYDRMEKFLLLFKSETSLPTYKYSYASSIFPNTNTFAVFNAIFIVTMLSITFNHPHLVNRYLCCLSLLLCTVGIFLSLSRNALLTVTAGISFLVISLVRSRKAFLPAFTVLLVTSGILFAGLYIQKPLAKRFSEVMSFESMVDNGESFRIGDIVSAFDLKDRPDIWARGMDLFIDNPIFGVGASQYIMRNGFINGETIHMHNIFGEIIVNHGIVGFALFMILMGAWLKNTKKDWHVYLIITLIISHLFDCFVPYNVIWLVFVPWLIAVTTRDSDELFIPGKCESGS
ncbi:MAG: hypothetical protein GT600_14745 [Bacteroidales bacterium]|nr:hypothetical protein [Bacteroidales bacterium]HPW37501.1 O-antigen ligase family protein [Syntrophorhabdus sp.]